MLNVNISAISKGIPQSLRSFGMTGLLRLGKKGASHARRALLLF